MNANVSKTNTGKLLVAILAMTMIIAGAAVVFSDSEVNAETQEQTDFLNAVSNGAYTLEKDTEVEIKTALTTSSDNLSGGSLTINATEGQKYTLTLTYVNNTPESSMITGVNIVVGTGVTLKVIMTPGESNPTSTHIFEDLGITINDGGSLVLSQSSDGQSWYNASEKDLKMSGNATMVFDAANGFSNVNADLDGTASITVQKAQVANLNFKSLNMASGTSVKILDGDSTKTNINIGTAGSAIAGTVDANNSNIYFTAGTLDNNGGSISAKQMKVLKPASGESQLTINGGSVSGEFVPATDGIGGSAIDTTITLKGVSVNNVTYADGVSLGEGSTVTMSGNLGIGDTINADLTVEDLAYLTDDLTIPEGKTLTISGYGTLDMLNHNITIEGTLVIERNGVVTSSVTSGENGIVLTRTGTIQNNGILGDTNTVTITGDGVTDQKVSMKGVSGLSVNLARNGTSYYLAVSGDVSRISGMDAEIALNGVTVTDAMTIGKNVNFRHQRHHRKQRHLHQQRNRHR